MGRGSSDRYVSGLDLLGPLRFILATNVALFHIWTVAFPDSGRHAVVGFFCLTGFLITKIARETYDDRPMPFLKNRFLRIFPTYWACLAVAVAVVFTVPASTSPSFGVSIPSSWFGWMNEITVFRLAPYAPKIIAQSWSLESDLYFYLIIGLATYRSFPLTLLMLAYTSIYSVLLIFNLLPGWMFYGAAYGMAPMFFLGSTAYFLSQRITLGWPTFLGAGAIYAVMTYGVPLTLTVAVIVSPIFQFHVIVSAVAVGAMLIALPNLRIRMSEQTVSAFRFLGRLGYPIFLLHLILALPFVAIVGADNQPLVFLLAYVLTLAVSSLIVVAVEFPMESLRRRIRADDPPMRRFDTDRRLAVPAE
jgi:peptidoglycan/LPS O-acetylase OafA/YrhL